MAKIEIKGTIEKIVRANGKNDAQLLITIPVSVSADVPLGAVNISIQTLQSALFGTDKEQPKPLRGTTRKSDATK